MYFIGCKLKGIPENKLKIVSSGDDDENILVNAYIDRLKDVEFGGDVYFNPLIRHVASIQSAQNTGKILILLSPNSCDDINLCADTIRNANTRSSPFHISVMSGSVGFEKMFSTETNLSTARPKWGVEKITKSLFNRIPEQFENFYAFTETKEDDMSSLASEMLG